MVDLWYGPSFGRLLRPSLGPVAGALPPVGKDRRLTRPARGPPVGVRLTRPGRGAFRPRTPDPARPPL
eukprot:5580087-Alexandrium_andersonii.AAC.1